jgi:hypothetical protein
MLDGVTDGPSMEVRQPVNESGTQYGENEPRLFERYLAVGVPKGAMSRFGRDSRVLLRAKEASEGVGTGCGDLPGGLGELGDVAVAVSGC